jgi:hypothetical protein
MTQYDIFKQVVLPLCNILPPELLRIVASFIPNTYRIRYEWLLIEFDFLFHDCNTLFDCMITKHSLIHQPYYISMQCFYDFDRVLLELTGRPNNSARFLSKLPNY